MSIGEHLAPVVGRALLALIFLFAAFLKVQYWDQTAAMMARNGFEFVHFFLAAAFLIEALCGFALFIGFRTRLAAMGLFGYVLAVNYSLHDFWNVRPELYAAELQLFVKNMAIAGGLLVIVGHGAGDWSVDSWRGE